MRAIAALAVIAAMPSSALPVHAYTTIGPAPPCTGMMTLTFAANITAVPTTTTVTVTGGAGCSLGSGSVSWAIQFPATLTADCEEIVIEAPGSFTPPSSGAKPVTVVALGPSAVQSWTFAGGTSGGVVATGVFTWTNQTEISNCLTGSGTSTMTLWGAIAVVTT
jgi:hypothetical protein